MSQQPPPESPPTSAPSVAARPGATGRFRGLAAMQFKAYRWYSLCAGLQQAAESMQMLANGWFAFELTGSTAILGLTVLAQAIPQTLLTFVGGVVSDRFPRSKVWQVCNVAALILPIWISISVFMGTIRWQDLVLRSFLFGIILAFRAPSRQGVMTEIVPRSEIMSAVSINQMIMNILQFAGPAAAGFMIAAWGIQWTYIAIAMFYVGAILALVPIKYERRNATGAARGSFLGNFKEGLKYVGRTTDVRLVLMLSLLGAMLAIPYTQLLPAFAKTILHTSPSSLGVLNSLTGLGALTGSVGITFIRPKVRGAFFIQMNLLLGIGLLAFALSSNYTISAALVFVVGIGQSLRQMLASTLLQTYTEDAFIGRVISINVTQMGVANLMAFIVAVAAEAIGIRYAFLITATSLVILGGSYWMFARRLRELE